MDSKEIRQQSNKLADELFEQIKTKAEKFNVIPFETHGSCFLETHGVETFEPTEPMRGKKRRMYALSILLLGEKLPHQGYGDNSVIYLIDELGYNESFVIGLHRSLNGYGKNSFATGSNDNEEQYHLGSSTGMKIKEKIRQVYNG